MRFVLPLIVLAVACGKRTGAGSDGGASIDATPADMSTPSGDARDGASLDMAPSDGAIDMAPADVSVSDAPIDAARTDVMVADATVTDVSRDAPRPTPRLTWTLMTPGWDAEFISGAANGEIWIVSRSGGALQVRADGTSAATTLTLSGSAYPTGLWVAGPNDAYVSAYANLVLHWDGSGSWKRDIMPSGTVFEAVWGSSPTDVYAVGGAGVYHSAGDDVWTLQPVRENTVSGLGALTGTGPSDLWLAGDYGEIFRSTGDGMWRREVATDVYYVNDLWAASTNEGYFVTGAAIMHRVPSTSRWVAESAPIASTDYTRCVWGSAPNDVYVGTDKGHLLHSVGDGIWLDEGFDPGAGVTLAIKGIWGRSASDVYLATSSGIYHGTP
jgi:hypothetical protein